MAISHSNAGGDGKVHSFLVDLSVCHAWSVNVQWDRGALI